MAPPSETRALQADQGDVTYVNGKAKAGRMQDSGYVGGGADECVRRGGGGPPAGEPRCSCEPGHCCEPLHYGRLGSPRKWSSSVRT